MSNLNKRKAGKMIPILYHKYNQLKEDDPVAIKLSNEIEYWEHTRDGMIICIYTEAEQCTLCRYKEVCEVRIDE